MGKPDWGKMEREHALFKKEWPLERRLALFVEVGMTVELAWRTLKDDYEGLTELALKRRMKKIADRKGLWLYREPPDSKTARFHGGPPTMDEILAYNRGLQKKAEMKAMKEGRTTT